MSSLSPQSGEHGLAIRPSPGLPSVELHTGTAVTHSHPPHWHDEYFVTAITGGEGVFHFQGQAHRAAAGTMMIVVPGEIHSHLSGPGGRSFRSLHAGHDLIAGLAPELPRLRSPEVDLSDSCVAVRCGGDARSRTSAGRTSEKRCCNSDDSESRARQGILHRMVVRGE